MNYLEQLISEWYQYQGFFVRQNVRIGKRSQGGHDRELDIIAFHPEKMKLIHIEASSDRLTWEKRREKLIKKFNYKPSEVLELFNGLNLPSTIELCML